MSELDRIHAILYAPGVHTGGGFVLLQNLLDAADPSIRFDAFLDKRGQSRLIVPKHVNIHWVRSGWLSRIRAEFEVRNVGRPRSLVLSFHGLPPLLPTRSEVAVFLQNKLYLDAVSASRFGLRTRLKLFVATSLFRMTSRSV